MDLFKKLFGKKIADVIVPKQSEEEKKYNELLMECFLEVQEKNKILHEKYGIGSHERWDLDQDVGDLEFSNNGEIVVKCKIVILGSYSSVSESWMWGWANDTLSSYLTDETLKIKEYGEANRVMDLTDSQTYATEGEAWGLGSYGCRILDGMGIYKGPTGNGFVLMMIKSVHETSTAN
ncbi:hypothetical protein ONV78_17405 [Hahella sp. CR1]|uniref:DUF6882 domain-containing protein n=1 Tax=Hahella sp. CR1 TaxID=2992807 RepID=UPI0024412382|nr:DUF6882 domain-containing protein [Hahella sp. CR1]MDG9669521.1 hypothetical protein [Hahella sp. CR1]